MTDEREHTKGGVPEDRERAPEPSAETLRMDYLADEYHDRFQTARELLREGVPPEDAAARANLPRELLTDYLERVREEMAELREEREETRERIQELERELERERKRLETIDERISEYGPMLAGGGESE